MSKLAARTLTWITSAVAFLTLTTSHAFAAVDPGLGEGSGAGPSTAPQSPPFEILGLSWQSALAFAVALVAVIGLTASVRYRRHASQHA
jgi:hypothetical protein